MFPKKAPPSKDAVKIAKKTQKAGVKKAKEQGAPRQSQRIMGQMLNQAPAIAGRGHSDSDYC